MPEPRSSVDDVWTYWEDAPGRHRAPYLDLCLMTIERQLDERMRLHVLDELAVFDWLPDLPRDVWKRLGSPVRRSDYARVRLVERYGGLWLDPDCIAMNSLRRLLNPLRDQEVVGWGADIGDRFYNGLFAARPGADLLRDWIDAQDKALDATEDWDTLPWAALGQDLMKDLLSAHSYENVPRKMIAPVLWYEWRRLFSPWQSPARVLRPRPVTVMLFNSVMGPRLSPLSTASLLSTKMLLGRLFRIALGVSNLAEEADMQTRLSPLSDLRYSRYGRAIEYRARTLRHR
jgi:hypothetical protein